MCLYNNSWYSLFIELQYDMFELQQCSGSISIYALIWLYGFSYRLSGAYAASIISNISNIFSLKQCNTINTVNKFNHFLNKKQCNHIDTVNNSSHFLCAEECNNFRTNGFLLLPVIFNRPDFVLLLLNLTVSHQCQK